jgi:hypothetical protein
VLAEVVKKNLEWAAKPMALKKKHLRKVKKARELEAKEKAAQISQRLPPCTPLRSTRRANQATQD